MDETVGVYVHVPFCERVCPYCDFAVEPAHESTEGSRGSSTWQNLEAEYVEDLLRELALRAPDFRGRRLASLYFGGGTPSLFQPESLARIREATERLFSPIEEAFEVTLEVNPSTVERARLHRFRTEAGINRVSLGVQSFDDSLLKALGRSHRSEESHATIEAVRAAGFENLSLDLMFAALHQTPKMLAADLDSALAHEPQHISTYELVIEEGTPFARAAKSGKLTVYPEEGAADLLDLLVTRLQASGYRRYELTNHALEGYEAVHNRRYWQRAPVLGIGVGAHSTDPPSPLHPYGCRPANPRERLAWSRPLREGLRPAVEVEPLSLEQAISEAAFLSLRTAEGLNAENFKAEFGRSPRDFFGLAIDRLVLESLLDEQADGRLFLTDRGRRLADLVAADFLLSGD
jgi:oxygen-independent coproporphyrinogen-3 oxidase